MDRLNSKMPIFIKEILSSLNMAGFESYIVGGCVRDALLGKTPYDWDICTAATPKEVKNCLKEYRIIETGISHGTVTALKNEDMCEITTFRKDGLYIDHRHPEEVSFTEDVAEDLSRRDFTINAMAFAPGLPIIDLFGGQADLKTKTLRCVGSAKVRFKEDALRILRALRFSSCLGFEIEEETKNAIYHCCDLLKFVANERINHEFKRLICGYSAHKILSEFHFIFSPYFPKSNIKTNSSLLENAPKDEIIRIALLLADLSEKDAFDSLKSLKLSNDIIKKVCFLLRNSNTALDSDKISLRRLISANGKENTVLLSEFIFVYKNYLEEDRKKIRKKIQETDVFVLSSLAVKGADLIAIGISPGRELGKLLETALNGVIEEKCENEKNSILSYLEKQS